MMNGEPRPIQSRKNLLEQDFTAGFKTDHERDGPPCWDRLEQNQAPRTQTRLVRLKRPFHKPLAERMFNPSLIAGTKARIDSSSNKYSASRLYQGSGRIPKAQGRIHRPLDYTSHPAANHKDGHLTLKYPGLPSLRTAHQELCKLTLGIPNCGPHPRNWKGRGRVRRFAVTTRFWQDWGFASERTCSRPLSTGCSLVRTVFSVLARPGQRRLRQP